MSYVDSWDSGQPGANWDSGLQWDVNVGPSNGSVQKYLDLITSEHKPRPKFMSMVANVCQPFADQVALCALMTGKYDLDTAEGEQLDAVGVWIGVSRHLRVPLASVYFSFDDPDLGFGLGTWKGPFDPVDGLVSLPDDAYRTLLRARAANNQWDGTIPGAYAIWDSLFAGTGYSILIQNRVYPFVNIYFTIGDPTLGFGTGLWAPSSDPTLNGRSMHMLYALIGSKPDAVTKALFHGGYLNMKPAGVMIDAFLTPSVDEAPYFGFGLANENIAGFGVGAWGVTAA